MKIEIFDVDHGQCAVITTPNGRRIMIDCGVKTRNEPYWWPHIHHFGQHIDLLALTNLDEDHVANFGDLNAYATIGQILSNPTIGAAELTALKPDGMGTGITAVQNWMRNPTRPSPQPAPDFGQGFALQWFYNPYIPSVTTETNDLSLVLIAQYGNFKIVFSGDIERAGWEKLLAHPNFGPALAGTCVFVASHHGRESGCSTELFNRFRPQIVVISDHEVVFETQETGDFYRQRCVGIPVTGTTDRRYVYTTRRDGSLQIEVSVDGSWLITPDSTVPWLRNTA